MLDTFVEVMTKKASQRSYGAELTELMDQLPEEEVAKIASGEIKLAYYDGDGKWLTKYQGTPLFEQAVALEEECLKVEAERLQESMDRRNDDAWQRQDMLRLKKRMLDLELHKQGLASEGDEPPEAVDGSVPVKQASAVPPELAPHVDEKKPEHEQADDEKEDKKVGDKLDQLDESTSEKERGKLLSNTDKDKVAHFDLAGRSMAHFMFKQANEGRTLQQIVPELDAAADDYNKAHRAQQIGAGIGALGGAVGGGMLGSRVSKATGGRGIGGAAVGAVGGALLGGLGGGQTGRLFGDKEKMRQTEAASDALDKEYDARELQMINALGGPYATEAGGMSEAMYLDLARGKQPAGLTPDRQAAYDELASVYGPNAGNRMGKFR